MGLSAGRLRHRIEVWRKQKVDDGLGGRKVDWVKVSTRWAEVTSQNGREVLLSQAVQGVQFFRITVRFGSGIRDTDQLRYRGTALNVRSVVDPDGMRESQIVQADTESVEALPDG
ncbi:phage head closure protein [Sphingomonas abietis]|uniref:Phage head closure protein n=1 Tax=Sphingomonas abietis TaxID=3012344 RepID=A0ABY7NQX2_9SPHN|nr:phage head closure protein [Sphingomonas abietis]WBO23935.1 phage head closure protein [Sphingomonas abietis]